MELANFIKDNGVSGICLLLAIHVLLKVAEFLFALREKKEAISDAQVQENARSISQLTTQLQFLELRLKTIETCILDVPKLKNDLRRFYSAVKELSGERWSKIRDEIMKDDFSL